MYGVTDQQVYYHKHTKEVLRFRLGEKFMIDVSNQSDSILEALQAEGTIIEESKIVIPSFPQGKKPRERRRFRKERKQMINQITEHPHLSEAIKELTSVAVSSLSESTCRVPIFLKDGKVQSYESVLSDEQVEQVLKGGLNEHEVSESGV